jgi:hypothetical protein
MTTFDIREPLINVKGYHSTIFNVIMWMTTFDIREPLINVKGSILN